jgi:hypothetical protein
MMQKEWMMKTPKTATSLIVIVIALGLAATGTLWKSNAATPGPVPHLFTTGMFGVARGQTARINAVCLPPGPCHPEMAFFDSMGNVISRSEPRELRGGQATFFDFDAAGVIVIGGRVELRAVVKAAGDPNIRQLNFTTEVFDNDTFKTTFFVPSDSFEDCACGGPIPENQ